MPHPPYIRLPEWGVEFLVLQIIPLIRLYPNADFPGRRGISPFPPLQGCFSLFWRHSIVEINVDYKYMTITTLFIIKLYWGNINGFCTLKKGNKLGRRR